MSPRHQLLRTLGPATLVAALLAACGGHSSPPSAVPTTLPAPSTTPSSLATDGPTAPYTWARDLDATLTLGGGPTTTISGILPPGQGTSEWTIAGTREAADGTPTATVWTSTNGIAWSAALLTSPKTPSAATSAVEWHTSIVIVGAVGSGATEQAAAWIAPAPGGPYTEVPVPGTPGGSSILAVTAGSLGLFALGSSDGQIAMWSSTNGQNWASSNHFDDLIATSVDPRVNAVLAVGNNVYAAGSVTNGTETDAALWASGDGINWHRVGSAQAAFGGPGDRSIMGLAQLGTGMVAVGGIRTGGAWSPASWISPDGASWSQPSEAFPMVARPDADVDGSVARTVSASASPAGTTLLVAVGGGSGAQRAWQSENGVGWTEVPLPPGAAASEDWQASLVGTAGTTTVIADSNPGQPNVLTDGPGGWSEPSINPAVFGAVQPVARPMSLTSTGGRLTLVVDVETPAQVLGGSATATAVVVSTDGRTWISATEGALSRPAALPPGASAAVRFRGRWVAVGRAAPVGATSAIVANPANLGVSWTSTDGIHWTDHGPLDSRPGVTPQTPSGLCVTPGPTGRVVAVGSGYQFPGGPDALSWASADGVHWSPAAIDPPILAGGSQEMTGCMTTVNGLVAYGATTGSTGASVPVLWDSQTGSQWTRQDDIPGTVAASPLTSVASSGSTWIAVAAGQPAVTGRSGSGLWLSQDGGSAWTAVDTQESPWQESGPAQLDLAAFTATGPVVVGTIAGRLAIWTGTANLDGSQGPSANKTP